MNFLKDWENYYRKSILEELKEAGVDFSSENISKILEEISFRVRSKKYSDKCPYYSQGVSCHPEVDDLNCFLCACPNYESSNLVGGCKINSIQGKFTFHPNLPEGKVWDCSDCSVNHSSDEVRRYLERILNKT
ncbi:MAG TPA: cysteine-rich small domain-containing protein [Candidatus Paceibacterota bacterium]|nr:cysteine-rich small domain-containing protein [Candidatus Paceibacterota bacterium]